MVSAEQTYAKLKSDLDMEADDHDGLISKKKLEEIISVKIGGDKRRTIPDKIDQLKNAHIIEPQNQFSYRYMMNGWKERWKARKVSNENERIEQILGARSS